MFTFAVGPYVVHLQEGEGPGAPGPFGHGALLLDQGEPAGAEEARLFLAVSHADDGHGLLRLERGYSPHAAAGFHPGAALIEETGVLFVGAGTWIAAYALGPPRKLWEDEAELGFWTWSRHEDVVLMAAELGFAAWDIRGTRLWERFVEPPWSYSVAAGRVHLEVMGQKTSFPLHEGPAPTGQ